MSRRQMLQRAGGTTAALALAPSVFLAACGDDGDSGGSGKVGGQLKLLSWEGFDLKEELAPWRRKTGVQTTLSPLATQDDVQTKLRAASAPPYDLSNHSMGYADLYRSLEIMTPLDQSKLPNYNERDIFTQFYGPPEYFSDGELWAVPWHWSSYVCIYNPKHMQAPSSWEELLDPQLKGRISMIDDPVATFGTAARLAGFGDKYPKLSKDEMNEVFDALRPYKAQSRTIAPAYGDLTNQLVSGDIVATFSSWAAVRGFGAAKGTELQMTVPREGSSTFVDANFIPPTSRNRATALAFINQTLEPKNQAAAAERLFGGVVTRKALPLLNAEAAEQFPYDDLANYFEQAPMYGVAPFTSDEYATFDDWLAAYQSFKAV